ncbi:hypothetical protein MTO98_15835 [Mucilaginibacter sp. SMC90]|uniref:hypothetical protein n=1 Tax=Mucilaginibacter sp. SMC90 TaxID=2929803 RepID=UPI001FB1E886|nr:hypothetical protein [Mucilaginibacter sp. SMC90]UOE52547.1 hypothetical protein MTO98_15835 [Mucilaginibacter sp. SMC90]
MEGVRTNWQLRHQTGQAARRSRNTTKPAKKRSPRISGHGFLNHSFKPFWLFNGNIERAETEFFRSLQHLCNYYDLLLPQTGDLSFPQNIYRSWEVVAERVKAIDKKLNCIILNDAEHEAVLATTTQFDTGRTLYYIPVKPLSKWTADAKYKQVAEVVTAIFAYLYQVAQIPMYSEYGTFLSDQYNYVEEMINEDMNEDDKEEMVYKEEQLDELFTLKNTGIHIGRLIGDKAKLDAMEDTVLAYANADERDNDLAILAIEFVQLYKAYPDRSIFDAIRPDLYYPEVNERIKAEEYISFYWSGSDSIIETVMSMIDCSFQEMGITDEPIDVVIFDQTDIDTTESFGFESRFFPLLDRLCTFLNPYDN